MYKDSSMLRSMFIDNIRSQKAKDTTDPEFLDAMKSVLRRIVVPIIAKGKGNLITLNNTQCTATLSGNEVVLTHEQKCEFPLENPVIHPAWAGNKHRYVWAHGPHPDGGNSGFVIKVDVQTNKSVCFSEQGLYLGSPVFIPRPNSEIEDDGVLAMIALHPCDETTVSLVVLDAATLQELARGTLDTCSGVPMPLHGSFFSKDILK